MLVAGVGSSNGADAVGWRIVDRLRKDGAPGVTFCNLAAPVDLLDRLAGVKRLALIDAVASRTAPAGEVRLYRWPDPHLGGALSPSSHGLGAAATLQLADYLGLTPPEVTIVGVAVSAEDPAGRFLTERLLDRAAACVRERLALGGNAHSVGGCVEAARLERPA